MADTQQVETTNVQATETAAKTEGSKSSVTLEALQAELESANKRIAELNKESAKHRKQAEEYQAAKQAEEDSKKSETEKLADKIAALTKQNEDTVQKANAKLIKAEILSKASKFIDADAVIALIDKSKLVVKEDGSVDGVDTALDELAKAKPHLLKTAQGSPLGATNPGAGATNETAEQKRARIFGTNLSPFDQSFVLKQGGGVVNNGE